jgi:hypothetical protein
MNWQMYGVNGLKWNCAMGKWIVGDDREMYNMSISNYQEAIEVMARATSTPVPPNVHYKDEVGEWRVAR